MIPEIHDLQAKKNKVLTRAWAIQNRPSVGSTKYMHEHGTHKVGTTAVPDDG